MLDRRLHSDFEEFVLARSGALLRTAYLLTGDRQHAEDLLQTALWRVSRRWGTARNNPHAYARRTLVNLAHDRRRRLMRRPAEVGDDLELRAVADPAPEQVLDRDVLVRALRGLPRRQRVAVILRYWEDLSVEEAAEAMGCSTGTVRSNASRGLARLRELPELRETTQKETAR